MRIGMMALVVASLAGLGASSIAGAAILASEDFSTYPLGNISGANGGTGFGGGWSVGAGSFGYLNDVRNSSPLSYPDYVAPDNGNYANVASGYGGPAFNYVQRTVDVAGAFAAYSDGTRVGLDGTTLYGSFLYNSVSHGQFWLQGASNHTLGGDLPTTGSNSLYLFKLTFGAGNADTLTLYNNPNLASFDINTATPTATFTGDLSFQSLVFVAPNSTNELRFDKIVLGSQLGDVAPVPEPTSVALLSLVASGLIMRRRRS